MEVTYPNGVRALVWPLTFNRARISVIDPHCEESFLDSW